MDDFGIRVVPTPWNKGKLVGKVGHQGKLLDRMVVDG